MSNFSVHQSFLQFHQRISITETSKSSLFKKRSVLQQAIESSFLQEGYPVPIFKIQGSFSIDTVVNPFSDEDFDLDFGCYTIAPTSMRVEPSAYHTRIISAIGKYCTGLEDKGPCIRASYKGGQHIDIPCFWQAEASSMPLLAHITEGYIESKPDAFVCWAQERIKENGQQLIRTVKYLKSWAKLLESKKPSLIMPSSFVLSILMIENYKKHPCDAISLRRSVEAISKRLSSNFSCFSPTPPSSVDLLASIDPQFVLKEFIALRQRLECANEEKNPRIKRSYWQEVFGQKFLG